MTDIPALRPPDETPAITALDELTYHWRSLMGELGFAYRRLWLLLLEPDGWPVPHLTTIDDIPPAGDPAGCHNLAWIASQVMPEGGSFAILLSRPGRHPLNQQDRSWAQQMTVAANEVGVSMWPMHFANDAELRVFAPDDVIGRAS